MDAATMTKQPIEVALHGETWKISPLGVEDVGIIEARLRDMRLATFLRASADVPMKPEEKSRRIRELSGMPIDPEEMQAGMVQPGMQPLALFLSMRKNHPSLTEQRVKEMFASFDEHDIESLQALTAVLQGMTNGATDGGGKRGNPTEQTGPAS